MRIELLYFDGCPSWQHRLEDLKSAMLAESLDSQVELVVVEDAMKAEQLHFLGSPSFRINGEEIWPEERDTYSLSCRIYQTSEGMQGSPTVDMLREALRSRLAT